MSPVDLYQINKDMNQNILLSPITLSELESTIAKTVEQVLEKQKHSTPANVPDELITRGETATLLRVSLPTLHEWTKRGLIPVYKVSTRVRYKKGEVLNLFQSGGVKKFGRF